MDNARTSPELPWKTWLSVTAFSYAMHYSFRRNTTVNRLLFDLFDPKTPAAKQPDQNGVASFDVSVDASRDLWFRLYTPTATSKSLPVIFYFHGGGFTVLAANSKICDDACRRLAAEVPAVVISTHYRRSPEHRYPSQYEDGMDVLKFVDSCSTNIEHFPDSGDLKNCFLAGDSAGANLAHNVAVRANDYHFSEINISGVIAIQPFFGGEERTESEKRFKKDPLVGLELTDWMWKAFLPEGSNRDHPAALFQLSPGLHLPATIVFVGGFDPLRDRQKRYYEALKDSGKEAYLIEYPNSGHCFYFFPELPDCSLFLKEVKDFILSQSTIY